MYTKTSKVRLSVIMIMLLFGGCNGNNDSNVITTSTTTSLSGVAQKGAFFKNSNVSLCKLDDKMVCTNEKIETKVSDDKGSYEFKTLPWSGLSRLSVSGYYFNEETGHKSLSPAVITAIVNIQSNIKQKSNTNILTDLRAKRMKKLVDEGKSQKDADKKSQEDIKQLFNLNSDDFTALDLVDFSAGKASINAELLRLSAAIAKSSNPVGYLEELMKIYNEGGLAAVLDSTLYKKLMYDIENVDMNRTLTTLGITSNVNNSDALSTLRIHPFARAMMSTHNNKQVIIKLFGTEFTTKMPSISMSIEGTPISIVSKNVADDNKSITLDMNESSNCRDMNLTFTLEYMDLKDVSNPLRTNTMLYANPIVMCDSGNNNATPIKVPDNQRPIAIIGMNYGELEVNEVNITAYAGQRVNGLESSYSHDRDPYPFGGITHCQFEDNNHVVIKEANSNACDLYNEVFDVAGVYDYTLTVTDKAGATDTSVAHISVLGNHSPEVSLTPNTNQSISVGDTLELNATANDADVDDELNLQWMYQKVGTSTQYGAGSSTHFSHIFNEAGDYNISVTARDNHNAEAVTSIMVKVNPVVVPINHTPTVRISPDGNKNLSVGDSLILKSISTDGDGDTLTTSWKLKNITANEFTSVPTYGATGFKYTFETEGTYLVVVEVEDGSDSMGDANITVNVTKPTVTPITVTLEDINISVAVKGSKTEQTIGSSDVLDIAHTTPKHGTVAYFKIGNEVPAFKYTSTDCFIGQDSFIYKSGSEYGRVNVTITTPTTLEKAQDVSKSIFNTETISGEYLRAKSANVGISITTPTSDGSSSLAIVGNEIVNYNYNPDNGYVGNDFFEYTLSETIDECSYSDVGRVDIDVKAPLPKVHLFSWNDGIHGIELWRTDGTADGTVIVKDINPGSNYSNATPGVKIGNINYFSADDGTHSVELWKSDGTESGTVMVKDINPGKDDGSFPYTIATIGNTMYFFAQSGDNNGSNHSGSTGLWKSDGTAAGTLLVQDFGNFSSTSYMQPGYLQAFGDKLIFSKDDSAGNGPDWEPWISDGSSSASKLKDIWPGDGGSDFISCLEFNSKCYAEADDRSHGSELWVTDGTESGTHMVKDIYEGTDSYNRGHGSVPTNLTIVGNKLFFIAFDTIQGISLWKSDGTENGTVLVKDSFTDEDETNLMTRYDYRYNYGELTDVNKTLYFTLNDKIHGTEVWKSDGTELGTVMVKDIESGNHSTPSHLTNLQGTLYFWYTDSDDDSNSGLWKSDGTEDGTVLVKAFSSDYDSGYEISGSGITVDNNKLYIELINFGNNATKEYWVSDGTEEETLKLVDGESMREEAQE